MLKKKNSHGQDFYRSGVAEKVPFPSLCLSSAHRGLAWLWVGASQGGRACGPSVGCRRWVSPLAFPKQPWSLALARDSPPNSSQGSCRSQAGGEARRPCSIPTGHPLPHPLLRPRAAPGRAHPHRNLPQPNPIPCRDANPPGGTRTRDPKPRGCPCTPS